MRNRIHVAMLTCNGATIINRRTSEERSSDVRRAQFERSFRERKRYPFKKITVELLSFENGLIKSIQQFKKTRALAI